MFNPIKYLKSLNWGKEDVKKIIMIIIMLLISCVIIEKFIPVIRVKIVQEGVLTRGDRLHIKIDDY